MEELHFEPQAGEWSIKATSDGLTFTFSGSFDKSRVDRERAGVFFEKIVTLVVTLVALIGLLGFIYSAWRLGYEEYDYLFLFRPHLYNLLSWVGGLALLYLWARRLHGVAEYELTRVLSPATVTAWTKAGKSIDVFSLFTSGARHVWNYALSLAGESGAEKPNTIHIFLSLLTNPGVRMVFFRFGVNPDSFKEPLNKFLQHLDSAEELEFVNRLPFVALEEALKMRNRSVDPLMLLCGLATMLPDEHPVQQIFFNIDLSYEKLEILASWLFNLDLLIEDDRIFRKLARHKSDSGINIGLTAVPTPYLNQFSRDLTISAKYHRLPLTRGRDEDLEKVIDLFGQGKNVLVVGAVGTGRKTVVNDLAYRMAAEQVPGFFQDKRLIKLELAGILGNRIPAEQALLNIFKEAEHSGNIIFAIEDLHSLKQAMGPEGLSLLEILLNHLENSNIPVIATTTPEGYQTYLRSTAHFDELFATHELSTLDYRSIMVACLIRASELESSTGMGLPTSGSRSSSFGVGSMFAGLVRMFGFKSSGRGVFFQFQSIEETVRLTDQYFKEKGQPEKSIEILKEVVQTSRHNSGGYKVITPKEIQELVAEKTHVPTASFTENEADKLMHLEDEIGKRVIGQKEAVVAVSEALRRARSGLSSGQRPIASFLFVGPTGVGKTELARTLSKVYFGDERYLLRLDMSEYEGTDGMRKLLGITGGEANTPFITHLKTYPFSLFLLDELEKASDDVLNLFLQVLDEGRITTAAGQTLDLTHTMIIGTSNAGTSEIQEGIRNGDSLDSIKSRLMEQILTKYYRPEFLNRFDGVILFTPLEHNEVEQITKIQLEVIAKQLLDKKIKIQFTDAVVAKVAKEAFDPLLGGRPIRRYIQDHVESVIAKLILSKTLSRGGEVVIDVNNAGEFVMK